MIRFYAPDIKNTLELPEVESGHCIRVLRMHEGDEIHVTDGAGHAFVCEITGASPKHTSVRIIEENDEPLHWSPQITLAVAPTKNMDRMEWLVEKGVEIGVNKVVFLNCLHSVRRVVKRERVEKIMVSAMKQSLKSTLPQLVEMIDFDKFIASETSECRFMGYCDPKIERREFACTYDGMSDICILIGPEGDFTPDEVNMAIDAGFMPVTFGNTRLRTETAALYALCSAHTIITQR